MYSAVTQVYSVVTKWYVNVRY